MQEIILIRHGQSTGNVKGVMSAPSYKLTKFGYDQGKVVCEYIYKTYKVGAVYSSRYIRARQTAEPLEKLTGLKSKAKKEFNELNVGKWNGKSIEYMKKKYPEEFAVWQSDIGVAHPPKGETWDLMLKRVLNGLYDVLNECKDKEGVIVIATHAGVIRLLQNYLMGFDNTNLKNMSWVSNCSITTVTYDGKELKLKEVGYDEYLGENKTFVPKGL